MQIRKETLDKFAEARLLEQMTDLVLESVPSEWKMPRDVAQKVAAHAILTARTYRLTTERNIANFALNMLKVNPDFHRQRKIHHILTDPKLPESERIRNLTVDATKEDWEEASKMTDAAKYWTNVLHAAGMPL